MITRRHSAVLAFVLISFGLSLYGGGCDSGEDPKVESFRFPKPSPTYPSAIIGSAVKGPIAGATIQIFYFGENGAEVEILSSSPSLPVLTGPDGSFNFPVEGEDLMAISSPLIVRSSGGTMYGVAVDPSLQLEAIIADPQPLTFNGVDLTCHLSVPSTVAAGLLKNYATQIGAAPTLDDAKAFMDQVESQLKLDLSEDPSDTETKIARFNLCIDQNLDLLDTPLNNSAVGELIDYFVANLSSSSGLLDDQMDADPLNPGTDTNASFTGPLATLFPDPDGDGPKHFILMSLVSDKEYIENNGIDTANITATLMDAAGRPYQDLDSVQLGKVVYDAPGILTSAGLSFARGEVRGELTSLPTGETGDVLVRAEYMLDYTAPMNGNTISLEIVVSVLDYDTDTDGDGLSDGIETETRYILIDTGGFGLETFADKLEKRGVWSDPGEADTDKDGLDDYTEYLLNTDPRSADTDGDGLTDEEEVNRWQTNPLTVDSDYDAGGLDARSPNPWLFDGNELAIYRTSPSLQDTDADGRSDFEEIFLLDRNPLVSDLPKLEMELVDAVDIRLDVTYAEEEGTSYEYGGEHTTGTTVQEHNLFTSTTEIGAEYGLEVEASLNPFNCGATSSFKVHLNQSFQKQIGNITDTIDHYSYSDYTTDSRTRTETSASGSMSAGIRLRNTGDIACTISKLGITVRHWEETWDRSQLKLEKGFKTVATLTPSLGDGFSLAPEEETPILQVEATDLNTDRVKELLRRPDSIYIEEEYIELEDGEGRNYAFLMEILATRTATIIIDPGQGAGEEYIVATNVQRGDGGTYLGVTLGEILGDILNLEYTTIDRQHLFPKSPSTHERILFRIGELESNLDDPDPAKRGLWFVVQEGENPPAGLYDFDEVPVRAGDRVLIVYVRDTDGDGVSDLKEKHYGTDVDTCINSDDCDNDGLTEEAELAGWEVLTVPPYWVTSSPTDADQDGDGLSDSQERAINTDPSLPDTDRDGIPDGSDLHPLNQAKVLYVDQNVTGGTGSGENWGNAFTDLQDALQEADAGYVSPDATDDVAEVWVADGVYKPGEGWTSNSGVSRFELVPNVGVYGGFRGKESGYDGETMQSQRNSDPRTNGCELSGDNDGVEDPDYYGTYNVNSRNVVFVPGTCTNSTILDGFLISGGRSECTRASFSGDPICCPGAAGCSGWEDLPQGGGGIFVGGEVILRNLLFKGNQTRLQGGAVRVQQPAESVITISRCVFTENQAFNTNGNYGLGGAVYLDHNRTLVIEDCLFQGNTANHGGAIAAYNTTTLIVKNSDFHGNKAYQLTGIYTNNQGGAVRFMGNTARIENSRFIGNEANYRGGGLYSGGGDAEVLQCLFDGNSVTSEAEHHEQAGGAIYFHYDANLAVVNSTIINNVATPTCGDDDLCGMGGGIATYVGYGSARIDNSILWGNDMRTETPFVKQISVIGGDIDDRELDRFSINSNCIEGYDNTWSYVGFGNIGEDPMFDETDGITLASGSPCIDTANSYVDYAPRTPGFQTLPETDLAGEWRITDGDRDGYADVDMGAYEYQP